MIDPYVILSVYHDFVVESGLYWDDYKNILADPRLYSAEDSFDVKSVDRSKGLSCKSLFAH